MAKSSQKAESILREIRSIKWRIYYLIRLEKDSPSSKRIYDIRSELIFQLSRLSILVERWDLHRILQNMSKKLQKKSKTTWIHEGIIDSEFIQKMQTMPKWESNIFFVLYLLKSFHVPSRLLEEIIVKDTLSRGSRIISSDAVSDS